MYILITGASSGIGFAIAERMAEAGHELLLIGRDAPHIERSRTQLKEKQIQSKFDFLQADLVTAEGRLAISTFLQTQEKTLDVVIHSAGIFEASTLLEKDPTGYERMQALNVDAVIQLNRDLIAHIKQPGGRIVLIGSTGGLEPHKTRDGKSFGQAYSVTKWALRGYAYNLREEAKLLGVGVTLISPGSVITEMWKGVDIPRDQFCLPEDVAEAVFAAVVVSPQAVIEEIVLRPLQGNV